MPSEPDNKMDDLLKAYAKKRRDEAGAPMEMHPATRRLLQAEAARLKPAAPSPSGSWWSVVRMFWPRLALASVVVLIGGIAVFSLFPPAKQAQEELYFAKQDANAPAADSLKVEMPATLSRRSLEPAVVPPAQPASGPIVTLADETKPLDDLRQKNAPVPALAAAGERDLAEAGKKLKAAEPARESKSPVPPAVDQPVTLQQATALSKDKETPGARGALPEIAAGGTSNTDSKQADPLTVRKAERPVAQQALPNESLDGYAVQLAGDNKQQLNSTISRNRFARVPDTNRPAPAKAGPSAEAAVLVNFIVEQSGEQLRVVDGDGSVYEGRILAGDTGGVAERETVAATRAGARQDEARAGRSLATKDARQQQAPQSQGYQFLNGQPASAWNFRASGTNRTLKQPVTIDAVVYGVADGNAPGQAGVSGADSTLRYYRNEPAQAPASRTTITAAPAQATGAASNNSYNFQSINLNNALRIQGNYNVGATNQRPLDAVPARNQP